MKKLLAAVICAGAVAASGCSPFPDPDKGMSDKPLLQKDFASSNTRGQLDTLGATNVLLRCDNYSKKVTGTFEFSSMDGRAAVTVIGATTCADVGNLFRWYAFNGAVVARENYKVALIEAELQALLTKAAIRPAVVSADSLDAARLIAEKFWPAIHSRDLKAAQFTCEKAGEKYHFTAAVRNSDYVSGQLNTRCSAAHQNFAVGWRSVTFLSEQERNTRPALQVESYNGVSTDDLVTVFGEFIGDGLPASKF